MARWRCINCEGIYSDVDSRGSAYYHVCPPGRVLVGDVVTPYPVRARRDENVANGGTIKAEGRGRALIIGPARIGPRRWGG